MFRMADCSERVPRRVGGPRRSWPFVALACLAAVLSTAQPAQTTAQTTDSVDLVLVLALDVSSSVDAQEFDVQKSGLAKAFRHASVIDAIGRGHFKRIAVVAVQWAGYEQQRIMIPWTIIGNEAAARAFSDRLNAMPRAYPDGATHLSGVIQFSTRLALAAPFKALRRVVDISGDGVDNISGPPTSARDAAVGDGITINGLAIANEETNLLKYYRTYVIGGPSAFVLEARDYKAYPQAILQKLVREIEMRLIY